MKEVEKSSLLEDHTSQRKKREIIFEPFVSYICNYLKQAQMPLLKIKKKTHTKPNPGLLTYPKQLICWKINEQHHHISLAAVS